MIYILSLSLDKISEPCFWSWYTSSDENIVLVGDCSKEGLAAIAFGHLLFLPLLVWNLHFRSKLEWEWSWLQYTQCSAPKVEVTSHKWVWRKKGALTSKSHLSKQPLHQLDSSRTRNADVLLHLTNSPLTGVKKKKELFGFWLLFGMKLFLLWGGRGKQRRGAW